MMDYYTLTYRLDGQGSDTTTNFTSWEDLYDFIYFDVYEDILKAIVSKVGNPDPPTGEDLEDMFLSNQKVIEISFKNIDTSGVTSMCGMFYDCVSLVSLDISGFDTGNVVDMTEMFSGCASLTALNLSNFNTSKVTETRYMFMDCPSLATVFVSDLWDNTLVTDSYNMFEGCTSLVGAVPYNPNKTDITMANYTTGYFTLEPLIGPHIGTKYPLPAFGEVVI